MEHYSFKLQNQINNLLQMIYKGTDLFNAKKQYWILILVHCYMPPHMRDRKTVAPRLGSSPITNED